MTLHKYLIGLLLIGLSWNSKGQNDAKNLPKVSALTEQYLSAPVSPDATSVDSKYVFSEIDNVSYVNAFIKINEQLDVGVLNGLGVLVGTKAGNIWTIKAPITSIEELTSVKKGIDIIQLDQPIFPNLDAARTKTKVNSVHEGIDLPQAYTGKDVVVGVLDVGFDYTHPTFYNESGTELRIKRVWEQKSTGTPPLFYSYGNEIVDTTDMITRQTDSPVASHGSHVAGIAAGSGFGGDGAEYRGVAYESDLVLVGITPPQSQWHNTGMTDIIDGLNYIYDYAESVGKPAVANLSWGCSIGPHDGSSLFSQAVDNLTGPGKIFTISGGNNGDNNVHLQKEFSTTDTVLRSFINWNSGLPDKKTWIDVWGEAGETFCVDLRTYKGANPSSTTGFICLNNTSLDTFLIGSDDDTVYVNLTYLDSDINGKPHAFFDIYSKTKDLVAVSVKGMNGEVHVWMGYVQGTRGYYNDFVTFGFPEAVAGDSRYTVGEMGCTESAIAVGAYASKNSFTNLAGQGLSYATYVDEDDIVPFSSRGPTTDGRFKPDITAPGLTLASAVNSFDASYLPSGDNYSSVVHKYTQSSTAHDYYYGESSGTSMSAPMVAGIVALILEAHPTATPSEIKSLLETTAIKDEHTTDTPDPSTWGFGKIDAHAMLQSIIASGLSEYELEDTFLFPNPTNDRLNVTRQDVSKLIVYNVMGEMCLQNNMAEPNISMGSLLPGIYFVSLFDSDDKLLHQERIIKL